MIPSPEWPLGPARQLRRSARTEIWIADSNGGPAQLVYASRAILLEAPNWGPDGRSLLLNGNGLLWRLDLATSVLSQVPLDGVPPLNNDHVVDAARGLIYVSANDGHIWAAPIGGGSGSRITHDASRYHFLHGVSPDGTTLAFVDLPAGDFQAAHRLGLIATTGGDTWYLEAGGKHLGGPEYSPDGAWLYVDTEEFGTQPGHAQLARVPAKGGRLEQLVVSETVDCFPHLSRNGEYATYLSFPAGIRGHPAGLDVKVRLVRTTDWSTLIGSYPLIGGQGTINVNSWSPDSRHFAFAAYPIMPLASPL
jgi:TolB protein